jgi:hypothetical protein
MDGGEISGNIAASGGGVGIKQATVSGSITTQYEIDVPLSSRSVFISYRGAKV